MGNQIPKYSALFKKVVVRYTTRFLFVLFCNIFYQNLLSTVPRFRTIFALLFFFRCNVFHPHLHSSTQVSCPCRISLLSCSFALSSTHIFIPPCLVFILLRRLFPSLQCLPPTSQFHYIWLISTPFQPCFPLPSLQCLPSISMPSRLALMLLCNFHIDVHNFQLHPTMSYDHTISALTFLTLLQCISPLLLQVLSLTAVHWYNSVNSFIFCSF